MSDTADGGSTAFRLNALELKLLATVTMVIDHVAACGLVQGTQAYMVCRIIGRLAFPIYCFLLAEGAGHTRSIRKYLLRLAAFALLSEIPYNLLFYGRVLYPGNQNIFFTLLAGLSGVALYRYGEEHWREGWKQLLAPAGMLLLLGAAELLEFDYGMQGVMLIYGMYLWRSDMSRGRSRLRYGALLVLFFGAMWYGTIQLYALLAFIPLLLYNGEQGPRVNKYLFYVFYPAHLLILFALCRIISGAKLL